MSYDLCTSVMSYKFTRINAQAHQQYLRVHCIMLFEQKATVLINVLLYFNDKMNNFAQYIEKSQILNMQLCYAEWLTFLK
jgi:hypothetical protein